MEKQSIMHDQKSGEPDFTAFKHEFVSVGKGDLHLVSKGTGPPILFLHGFPDLWCIWSRVMETLAPHYETFAPDQRGYNLSWRPKDQSAYTPQQLLADIGQLVERIDGGPIVIVGHDWGGVLAAWFAASQPDKVDKLILINAPHPAQFQRLLWNDPQQRDASSYISKIKSGEAEKLWLARGPDILFEVWTAPARAASKLGPEEAELYRAAWRDPLAWKAMCDWYRASPFEVSPLGVKADWTQGFNWTIQADTLLIWGEKDDVFVPAVFQTIGEFASNATTLLMSNCGHSPLRDEPYAVANAILNFLGPPPAFALGQVEGHAN